MSDTLPANSQEPVAARLLRAYGATAIVVYFAIFALSLLLFFGLMRAGLFDWFTARIGWEIDIDSGTGLFAQVFAAWLAAKLVQPLRIALTLIISAGVVALRARGSR